MAQENINLLGIKISNVTCQELDQHILNYSRENKKGMFLNVNIYAMNFAHRYAWFRELLNSSPIVFCDGDGVRFGARILGMNIKEKITYNRWVWQLLELCAEHRLSIYFLGAAPASIDKSVQKIHSLYPKLQIKGYHHGYISTESESKSIINEINVLRPNVLLVGMGMPIQERWLKDNFHVLQINVALTGGAVFDYISGVAKMTPDLFYNFHLEWLYRWLHEPQRLFFRYAIGNPWFLLRVLKAKIFSSKLSTL